MIPRFIVTPGKIMAFTATVALTLCNSAGYCQQKEVRRNNQYWVGYMTSATLSEKYALWNDFHYVPEGFALIRTGLTRNFGNAAVTGGYAFLWLPFGPDNHLKRHEHRPWGQAQFTIPTGRRTTFIQRIRYDARFRENISPGESDERFSLTHRVRSLSILKYPFGNTNNKLRPYASLSDEIMVNFGKEVTYNNFDQNRISIALGIAGLHTQYQLGLMSRYVQTGPSKFTINNTLVLWVTQKFDFRRKPETIHSEKERAL